jgi:hypothetical protein
MQIFLIAGDNDWSSEGHHVCDGRGFSIVLDEPKTIEVYDEIGARILPIIEDARVIRGLERDGSVPLPPEPEEPTEPETPPPPTEPEVTP